MRAVENEDTVLDDFDGDGHVDVHRHEPTIMNCSMASVGLSFQDESKRMERLLGWF